MPESMLHQGGSMRDRARHGDPTPSTLVRVAEGLLLGLLLGYVAAWVLPRRRETAEGAYEAPIPEQIVLPKDIDLRVGLMPGRQRTVEHDLRVAEPEATR
jgi:hypothetical protein